MRNGLLFPDGEPVRATDAVTSIRRWAERDTFGQRLIGLTASPAASSPNQATTARLSC